MGGKKNNTDEQGLAVKKYLQTTSYGWQGHRSVTTQHDRVASIQIRVSWKGKLKLMDLRKTILQRLLSSLGVSRRGGKTQTERKYTKEGWLERSAICEQG